MIEATSFSFNSRVEDDESKLFELNMALPLFKMISIDEGIKNVETETDIGKYFILIHSLDCIYCVKVF